MPRIARASSAPTRGWRPRGLLPLLTAATFTSAACELLYDFPPPLTQGGESDPCHDEQNCAEGLLCIDGACTSGGTDGDGDGDGDADPCEDVYCPQDTACVDGVCLRHGDGDADTDSDTDADFDIDSDSDDDDEYPCLCLPGGQRYCEVPAYSNWGTQACQPDGLEWGACEEVSAIPSECAAVDGWYSPTAEACCVEQGFCCQDMWDLNENGDSWESLGNCVDIACKAARRSLEDEARAGPCPASYRSGRTMTGASGWGR